MSTAFAVLTSNGPRNHIKYFLFFIINNLNMLFEVIYQAGACDNQHLCPQLELAPIIFHTHEIVAAIQYLRGFTN